MQKRTNNKQSRTSSIKNYEIRDAKWTLKLLFFLSFIYFIIISILHIINALSEIKFFKYLDIHDEIIPTLFDYHPVLNIVLLFVYFGLIALRVYQILKYSTSLKFYLFIQFGLTAMACIWFVSLVQHVYYYFTSLEHTYSYLSLIISSVLNGYGVFISIMIVYYSYKLKKSITIPK